MRISDWSSDVCSSDLSWRQPHFETVDHQLCLSQLHPRRKHQPHLLVLCSIVRNACDNPLEIPVAGVWKALHLYRDRLPLPHEPNVLVRSEEHTSELQSLMRTSYAVFCLKKKNRNTQIKCT